MIGPEMPEDDDAVCELCGGSGVLQISASAFEVATFATPGLSWDEAPYAAACHGCPAGWAWAEAGL